MKTKMEQSIEALKNNLTTDPHRPRQPGAAGHRPGRLLWCSMVPLSQVANVSAD